MREAWTDRRLDGLDHKVDRLEHKVDQFELRVEERFARVDGRFGEVNRHLGQIDDRLVGLAGNVAAFQRTMLQMGGVIIAALLGIIATQI